MESHTINRDSDHVYQVEGVVRPGVTSIIDSAGLSDGTYYTEASRDRGTMVSVATELFDRGKQVDMESLGDARPYVEAYIDYHATTCNVWTVEQIETPVFHPRLGYCGTLDRIMRHVCKSACPCDPELYPKCPGHVLDIKSGVHCAWHFVQTAAYQSAAYAMGLVDGVSRVPRYNLYLTKEGKWKMKTSCDNRDLRVFRAALTLRNWRRIHG